MNAPSIRTLSFVVIFPLLLLDSAQTVGAQTDGAVVTRRGAVIQGTVEGSVVALDETAIVSIVAGATVSGDLALPAERLSPKVGSSAVDRSSGDLKISTRVLATNPGGASALLGQVRAVEGFPLPAILVGSKPVQPETALAQGTNSIDFAKVGSFTLRQPGARVAVPVGSYGELVVAQGTVILGVAGTTEPTRYEIRSLDIQAGGAVEVIGPVVVTLAGGATWRGQVGNLEAPFWLDVRFAHGDLAVTAPGRVYGYVTAPEGLVSLDAGATLTGGVAGDRVEVAAGATMKIVVPDWTAEATERSRPRFMHKALRLQARLPDLSDGFRHGFSPGISYIEDVPYVMLAEANRPANHPRAPLQQWQAVFEAAVAVFQRTGFERGGIVLANYARNSAEGPPMRNIMLTRLRFEELVAGLGGKESLDANIREIARNPQMLEAFFLESLRGEAGLPSTQ